MLLRLLLALAILAPTAVSTAQGMTIFLDADTVATGGTLDVAPLSTPFGDISFVGEVRPTADADLVAAGSTGNVFDVDNTETATMLFSFDVESITFIYGGNDGVMDIEARDINDQVVDFFFQASTGDLQPAGPVTLSGGGIRKLFWHDPGFNFAPIDNLTIEVPEPAAIVLAALGLVALGWVRRRRAR
ncbi:MAG: PEP-CTERM sorting domain-containing protein [Planctomycetota bacterium]|nr:MAG: PEP-CTERM sorting domain-containing protein [Planctomycetota bacterium]